MKLHTLQTGAAQVEADAVVIGLHSDQSLGGSAAEIDAAAGGSLSRLLESKEATGERLELTTLLAPAGVAASQVLLVGLGDTGDFGRGEAFQAAAAAAKRLAEKKRRRVAFYLGQDWSAEWTESGVCGVLAGCQGQDLHRREKNLHPFDEFAWAGGDDASRRSGQILGESVNLTRNLVNGPPSEIYPETFAAAAEQSAGQCALEVEVWDRDRLESEKCGSLLAVARGSARPPRLVLLRHRGADQNSPTLALVGKGVTFDSGGLSLKPSEGMQYMKSDMAGAATVLGAMRAIGLLKLPVNVLGVMGLVENMVSGESYKLGDVLTARNSRTIEVLNTDAEGRLVLADALSVAVDLGASKIIDLATLTGACIVALGADVAGLMSNNDPWRDEVQRAAELCGEPAWPLPMFRHYSDQIRSQVADIKNIGEGRAGGAITAAKFLEEFVADTPWAHLDIAGPSFRDKPKSWMDGGATGAFVRTLVEVARSF